MKYHKEENHAIVMTRLYWKMDKQYSQFSFTFCTLMQLNDIDFHSLVMFYL
jgi:hypothetical protein